MRKSPAAMRTLPDTHPPAGPLTILLVEDDRALRELLRITLEACGYAVLAAADAAEALRLAQPPGRAIALLVSDVTIPGLSGPELARRLAVGRAGLPVLLLSGYARDAAMLGPQVPFLQKPFSPRVLGAKVREILGPDAAAHRRA